MSDGDHDSDDLDCDEVARVLDKSEGCVALVGVLRVSCVFLQGSCRVSVFWSFSYS